MYLSLSILLCLSIITTTVNIDINYVQNNELKVRKSKDDSEFIFVEKEEEIIDSFLPVTKDQYEPNNAISTATNICPENFYALSSYNVSIEATLDYTGLLQDVDYYFLHYLQIHM